MAALKEITVFCEQGDSSKLKTWSNVPYFLTATLEASGVKVNRVSLHPGSSVAEKIFYKLWNVWVKGVTRRKGCPYRRSSAYFYLMERKVRAAVRKYADSDVFLFTSYSMSSKKYSDKPSVLFCDWTAEYDLLHAHGRKIEELPSYDVRFMQRQKEVIEGADAVVCLFPGVTEHMRKVYPQARIHYIGNVVNSLEEPVVPETIERKEKGHDILFVGKKHYMKGARELLAAFSLLRTENPELRLHIIGLTESQLGQLPEGVTCYGYLDKSDTAQRRIYYDLLSSCRLFVNTTPQWGAFSASVEAMYHYMPVLVTPYGEFVKTFGAEIGFGLYHDENGGERVLAEEIKAFLEPKGFREKAECAHAMVADMKWDRYVSRLTNIIEKMI